MTARTPLRATAAACAVAGVLATAACTGPTSPPLPPPSSPSGSGPATVAPSDNSATAAVLRGKISALLVQCFADHQLIPQSALENGKAASPSYDSSTWLHNGKVTENQYFGDWWSDPGSAVVVKGKMLVNWVSEIAANSKAWPTSICGPMPSIGS